MNGCLTLLLFPLCLLDTFEGFDTRVLEVRIQLGIRLGIYRYLSIRLGIYRYLVIRLGIYRYLVIRLGIYRYLGIRFSIYIGI